MYIIFFFFAAEIENGLVMVWHSLAAQAPKRRRNPRETLYFPRPAPWLLHGPKSNRLVADCVSFLNRYTFSRWMSKSNHSPALLEKNLIFPMTEISVKQFPKKKNVLFSITSDSIFAAHTSSHPYPPPGTSRITFFSNDTHDFSNVYDN